MDNRPVLIELSRQPDQSGGDWEITATYPNGERSRIATFSAFTGEEIVRKVADMLAREYGLDHFEFVEE